MLATTLALCLICTTACDQLAGELESRGEAGEDTVRDGQAERDATLGDLPPDGESVIFTCASPTDARLCQWHPDDAEPTWLTPPDDTTERLLLIVE